MTVLRRALAVLLPATAAVALAVPANAATIKTDSCVRYVAGQQTMTIAGAGFTPNGSVSMSTLTKTAPEPASVPSRRSGRIH